MLTRCVASAIKAFSVWRGLKRIGRDYNDEATMHNEKSGPKTTGHALMCE